MSDNLRRYRAIHDALRQESGKFRGALLRPCPHRDTLKAWNQYSNHPAFINSALS